MLSLLSLFHATPLLSSRRRDPIFLRDDKSPMLNHHVRCSEPLVLLDLLALVCSKKKKITFAVFAQIRASASFISFLITPWPLIAIVLPISRTRGDAIPASWSRINHNEKFFARKEGTPRDKREWVNLRRKIVSAPRRALECYFGIHLYFSLIKHKKCFFFVIIPGNRWMLYGRLLRPMANIPRLVSDGDTFVSPR